MPFLFIWTIMTAVFMAYFYTCHWLVGTPTSAYEIARDRVLSMSTIRPTRAWICPKHEIGLVGHCDLCVLESLTGRTHRTVNQIMEGLIVPSWEREQL